METEIFARYASFMQIDRINSTLNIQTLYFIFKDDFFRFLQLQQSEYGIYIVEQGNTFLRHKSIVIY